MESEFKLSYFLNKEKMFSKLHQQHKQKFVNFLP